MNEDASLKKGMCMNKNRFAKRLAVTAGFFFLCAAPGLMLAQSSPPSPARTAPKATPAAGPKGDEFAGLTFTDEQQARIAEIHKSMKARMDEVAKNGKLTPQQKDAMLESYRRTERGQVFRVLTSAQQKQVLKRARIQHAAEEQKKQSQPN
jgi:hypothetical protein